MADKLQILLLKILITLFISFTAESQFFNDFPSLKEFKRVAIDAESNLPEQLDINNINSIPSEDPNLKELERLAKDAEVNRPDQFNIGNMDDIFNNGPNLKKLEQLTKEVESLPEQFDYGNNDDLEKLQKIVDDERKMIDELSKLDANKPFDFNPSDYRVGSVHFKASDTPYLILCSIAYIAAVFVFVLIIVAIAHCVKRRKSRQSPNSGLSLWFFAVKNTDSERKESSGDGCPQESKGDKTKLIV